MKTLKIFTYDDEGKLIKENLYSDFLFVFNEVISHNYLHEKNKRNIIVATEFPPEDLFFDKREWKTKENKSIKLFSEIIKIFE